MGGEEGKIRIGSHLLVSDLTISYNLMAVLRLHMSFLFDLCHFLTLCLIQAIEVLESSLFTP